MGWERQHFLFAIPLCSRAWDAEMLGDMYDCNGQISFFFLRWFSINAAWGAGRVFFFYWLPIPETFVLGGDTRKPCNRH